MQPIVIAIPDCRFHYQWEEQTFAVSPIDAMGVHDNLAKENIKGEVYLQAFKKWLQDFQGAPDLPLEVVDYVADHIVVHFAEVKKKRFEPLNSPSSTDLIPSD